MRWTFFLRMALFSIPVISIVACGGGGGGGNGGGAGKPGTGLPVTITGTVRYEDKTYDQDGFSGTILKPIRKAVIEVVREADGKVLNDDDGDDVGDDATGLDGKYSLTFTNNGEAGVYVRVLAQTSDGTVVVKNPGGGLYAIVSPVIDDTAADSFNRNLTAAVATNGGAFNILDVFLQAAEFIESLTGAPPPLVTALWAAGSCDGTYFTPVVDTISILGGCGGDTDEYDDPVLLHEYGHFIAAHYSKDDSPGGSHNLADSTQDIRLSWSEGWGNFFSGAVRGDPLYVDTVGDVANIAFEMEGLTSPLVSDLPSLAIYTTNELSVSAVLWDILDATPAETFTNVTGTDAVSAEMTPLWDVIANYLTCAACGVTNVSIEDFWDGWFAQGYGLQAEMETVSGDRLMALTTDGDEPDDSPPSGSVVTVNGGPTSAHTLYPAGDSDHFHFSATGAVPHTVETLSLTNGADTFIEVLDTDEITVLGSNDNADGAAYSSLCGVFFPCPPNDATTLSSKLTFTPSAPGTYYVRVKRSTNAPPSAGMDGGYEVQITSP